MRVGRPWCAAAEPDDVDAEVISVSSQARIRGAAITVAAGFAGLAVFQLALAAGAPLGAAAWGGTETVLPASLRIGSAFAVLLYAVAAFAVLRCVGFSIGWMPPRFAHVATWVLGVILPLSALANVASHSGWERYLLAPSGLLLGIGCVAIARHSRAPADEVALRTLQSGPDAATLNSMPDRPDYKRPVEKHVGPPLTNDLDDRSALSSSGGRASPRRG
jgi:hypothetical protein